MLTEFHNPLIDYNSEIVKQINKIFSESLQIQKYKLES